MFFHPTLTKTLIGSIYLHYIDEKSEVHVSQKISHLYFYCFTIVTPVPRIGAARIRI